MNHRGRVKSGEMQMTDQVQDGESGQGMIEYGLLVALISIVAIGVITAIGTGLIGNFQSVLNAL
jgi:pilus assembly protein Flp/PilA